MADFVKLKTGTLRDFGLDEKWLQDRIVDDPEILGIPGVSLRDRERRQPRAGRLDVLLETEDSDKRYEVEIQLGATDESHIIRTIEYWDLERQRYPQYDHCAVIVAEDITSRFFNVIGLFNRHLPIIAINVTAVEISAGKIGLVFTHVLREQIPEDDSASAAEQADRAYWLEKRGKSETELAEYVVRDKFQAKPNYTKRYMSMDGRRNSITIHARKNRIFLRCRNLPPSEKWDEKLQESGVEFDAIGGRYRLTMHSKDDVDKHWDIICEIYREMEGDSYFAETQTGVDDASN